MRAQVVASILAAARVPACDGPPANSKATLKALSASRVLVPLLGATAAGSAQDAGCTPSLAAPDPGVEEICAAALSFRDVSYDERTCLEYEISRQLSPVPHEKRLPGLDGSAIILIDTAPDQPDLADAPKVQIKLSTAPPNRHSLRGGDRLWPEPTGGYSEPIVTYADV